jgi:hypothetical protein
MSNNQPASVRIEKGSYVVSFPYDPMSVSMLKSAVPSTSRSWDNNRKAWIIAADYKKQAENALGMSFPDIAKTPAVKVMRLLTVHYLGQCKERGAGDISAMGLLKDGSWGAIFPMSVLVAWFENPGDVKQPAGVLTLYSVLGAHQKDDETLLKKAYHRMLKQWHPDVCREPDANKMTLRIREAYDILSNPRSRGRYDAGLALEATIKPEQKNARMIVDDEIYRSPLRCGYILCEGVEVIGRFIVSRMMGRYF